MSSPTDSTRPVSELGVDPPRSISRTKIEVRRTVRLAGLGGLAAAIGAVAAYQVFAPANDATRKAPPPPLPPPAQAAATSFVGPTLPAAAPVLRYRPLSSADAYLANAAIPDARVRDPAARPFALAAATRSDRDLAGLCLTQAVYYEAASESLEGQRAVAQVVLNRVRDDRYPRTVCGVVFQGAELRTGCQFSFTCDGSMGRRPAAAPWRRAHEVAEAALDGFVMSAVGHATHYHTVWVTPYWSPSLTKLGRIGAHIFYRWGARRAAPATEALAYAGGETLADANAEPSSPVVVAPAPEALTPAPPSQLRPQPQFHALTAAEPPPSLPAPVDPPAPAPPPYRAAPRHTSLDNPNFAARDQGR